MKSIVIYFSRAGYNYVNGEIKYLEIGNTEVIAKKIAELTNSDIFKIEPMLPYSEDYSECIEEASQDQKAGARPELKEYPKKLEYYAVIYLGYPNYWDRAPAMINTFLGNIDLTGKTVIPFCTSSSDGIEGSMTDIRNSAQGANILEGLRISGGSAESNRSEIQTWLNSIGF